MGIILMKAVELLPLLCGAQGILDNGMCRQYHDFDNFVRDFVDSDHEAKLRIMMELGEQAWNATYAYALDQWEKTNAYALELWEDENIQAVVTYAVDLWEDENVQAVVSVVAEIGADIGEDMIWAWEVTSATAVEIWENESVQAGLNMTVDMTYDLGYKLGGAAVGICEITSSATVYVW